MEVKLAISMIYAAIENEDLTVLSIKNKYPLVTYDFCCWLVHVCAKKLKVCVHTDVRTVCTSV